MTNATSRQPRQPFPLWAALAFAGVVSSAQVGAAQATEVPATGDLVDPTAEAPRETTYETARGVGMGLGARSSAQGTSALAYNPANLGMTQLYHVETMAAFVRGDKAWMYGGSVVDTVTSQLAAGLSFHGFHGNGERALRGYDGRLALGMPISESIGIGAAARYVNLRSRLENEDGETIGADLKAFTLDVAVRATITQGLNISLLGNNLIRTHSPLAPMLLGGGLSYSFGTVFSVGADIFVDMTTFEDPEMLFGIGLEYLAGESFPLRVGYRRDQGRDLNQVTAAVGYVDQQFGLDIALRQDVAHGDNDTQILLNIRYHVQ